MNFLQCLELVWVIPPNEIHLSDKMLGGGGWSCVYEVQGSLSSYQASTLDNIVATQQGKFEKEIRCLLFADIVIFWNL